jgi:hypothetical protein
MMKLNKALMVNYNSSENSDFFSLWIEYLAPKHHLTKSEQKFLAACLRQRYILSKSISDETLLDETTLNDTYRTKIRQDLGISTQQMQNTIAKLKKLHILVPRNFPFSDKLSYYKISPSFIPNYNEGEDFNLLFIFKNVGATNTESSSQGVQSTKEED